MDNGDLAYRLQQYRITMDLSYRKLARVLGIDVNTIRRIESGGCKPWDRTAAKVERILDGHVESEQLP